MSADERVRARLAHRLAAAIATREGEVTLADRHVALAGTACLARAARLRQALDGVPAGGRVGVLMPASAAQALAILALLGSRHVPSVLDPWHPPGGALGLAALIVAGAPGDPPPPIAAPIRIRLDPRGEIAGVERDAAAARALPPPLPAAAALVLHTSGSLGTPKAVVLPAAGLLYTIDRLIERLRLDAETVAAVTLPLHHTMGLNTQLLPTLAAGGRAVFFAGGLRLGRIYRDVLETGATSVALVAELLAPCAEERRRRGLGPAVAVRDVQLAGGAIRGRHLELARALFPRARLHKGYGLTEAIRVAMSASDETDFERPGARVLPGQEVAIRDGEIVVRGPNVMLGYDRAAPEESFTADGWLRTGDLGHFDETGGRLVVEGRRDRMFKSYGHRIAAAEIERAALTCPEVVAAACLPVPCPKRGQRPILFVETAGTNGGDGGSGGGSGGDAGLAAAGRAAIERALLGALAPYKVPKDVLVLQRLPRSSVGKVVGAELERLWRERPGARALGRGPAGCRFLALAAAPVLVEPGS